MFPPQTHTPDIIISCFSQGLGRASAGQHHDGRGVTTPCQSEAKPGEQLKIASTQLSASSGTATSLFLPLVCFAGGSSHRQLAKKKKGELFGCTCLPFFLPTYNRNACIEKCAVGCANMRMQVLQLCPSFLLFWCSFMQVMLLVCLRGRMLVELTSDLMHMLLKVRLAFLSLATPSLFVHMYL